MTDPYAVLGVKPEAEEIVIEAAYKSLVKQHHPDSGGSADKFKEIKEAYDDIKNSTGSHTEGKQDDQDYDGLFDIFDQPIPTESVMGKMSEQLFINGNYLTLALLRLSDRDVSDIVYDHQIPEVENTVRKVAIFHVRNTSDRVLSFYPAAATSIIGSDGFTYGYSTNLQMNPLGKSLPKRMGCQDTHLEPGARTNHIVIIEELPEGVSVDRVVYTQSVHAPGSTSGLVRDKERFEFVIDNGDHDELNKLPS